MLTIIHITVLHAAFNYILHEFPNPIVMEDEDLDRFVIIFYYHVELCELYS